MSTEPFIGEVKLFGFYFAPVSYMNCQGQMLSIAQYTALFSLLGTTYGGNGQTTFALPDLQGRIAIGQGTGPGLPPREMGESAGNVSVTMITANIPNHVHGLTNMHVQIRSNDGNASENSPGGNYYATTAASSFSDTPQTNGTPAIIAGTTDVSGSGIPFSILNPYLCMNYSIAVEGIFPSRN
jgi:microcystin-dependent protein